MAESKGLGILLTAPSKEDDGNGEHDEAMYEALGKDMVAANGDAKKMARVLKALASCVRGGDMD